MFRNLKDATVGETITLLVVALTMAGLVSF